MKKNFKEKLIGATGSISGAASVLGSWQICHNVCLGLIALLSVVGITITGMPLLFLTTIAVPMWTAAVVLLLITLFFYFKMHCISSRLIMLNAGLIIAGVPFQAVQKYNIYFWLVGGAISVTAIALFITDKIEQRRYANEKK